MNGVHDMGGLQCFGALDLSDEQMFHHEWEREVLGLSLAMGATGTWNLDESRFARESLPASAYLHMGYYRIWLEALQTLLLRHELVSRDELDTGVVLEPAVDVRRILKAENVATTLAAGSPVDRPSSSTPRFSVGSIVRVRNLHCPTHTRMPGYIRRCEGEIDRIHGCHVYPDSHALGEGENPQWLYNVRFDSQELWGQYARKGAVHVDCWEPYLASPRDSSSSSRQDK